VARGRNEGLFLVDLGSEGVRALAVTTAGGRPHIRGAAVGSWTAGGDAFLTHPEVAREELGAVVAAAARAAGLVPRRALAAAGGTQLRCVRSQGSLALKLPVCLRGAHLERALEAAACLGLPRDQEILHVLPTEYRVDGARTRRAPVGVHASSLVAECCVITASRPYLDALERCVASLDLDLLDVVAEPLAAAWAHLRAEDQRRGAVLVDIGAERIGAAVFRDAVLQGLAVIGAGAAHVTRDLAFALGLDVAAAEALKRRFGVARAAAAGDLETELASHGTPSRVSQACVAGVIEARMRELFALVRAQLERAQAILPGDRVVLCGGGALLPGTRELAADVFGLPVRLAAETPDAPGAVPAAASGVGLGLLQYVARCDASRPLRGGAWRGAVERLRDVFGAARREAGGRSSGRTGPAAWDAGPPGSRVGEDLEVRDVRVRARV
jgi:cell division protein FtsA